MKQNSTTIKEDKRNGGVHKVRRPTPQVCETCKGLGTIIDINGDQMECPLCDGLGEIDD